jgi:hypothetical protein
LRLIFKISSCFRFEDKFIKEENKILNLIENLNSISLLLVKMAIQCIDFSEYSCSIIVISSFYAATAFIKNFKEI